MSRLVPSRAIAAVVLAGALIAPAEISAQTALERNLPARDAADPVSLDIEAQTFGAADDTPLGVDLVGIHLIGLDEAVAAAPPRGISGSPRGIDAPTLQAALLPLLDRPLSLALAGEAQAAIARVYRQAGYPFVSVTLPPQEVTGGVLQIRVIEFGAGDVAVSGVDPDHALDVVSALRIASGERIDARALEEDLNWLSRSPYLLAEGVFRPGETTALSDLNVNIVTSRPWQISAGWSNSGSEDTGRDRFFLGLAAGLPVPGGPWGSYQLTTSDDIWRNPGIIVPQAGEFPLYVSHAGRLTIPTLPRQSLEIAPTIVMTRNEPNAFIAFENTTLELPVIYRSAVSNLLPGRYWGDIYGGVEFKHLQRTTYFSNIPVAKGDADLFQLVLGWNHRLADPWGQTVLDLRLKANPGGVLQGNNNASWQSFSNGRVNDASYAYLAFDISRTTPLPGRLAWISTLSGTLAGQALPDTERLSLGGRFAVRGYDHDDASVDSGVLWRNELRLPTIPLAGALQDLPASNISPYIFADIGTGIDQASKNSTTLGSLGAGLDLSIGETFSANAFTGVALMDTDTTKTGDWKLQLSVTARF